MDNEGETIGIKTSLFNAGVAKLMRIDRIKTQIHLCRVYDNEHQRRRWLGAYRAEMNERFNTEEKERCEDIEKNLDVFLKSKVKKVPFDIDYVDQLLDEYELYLAGLEYKYGFSMPDREDAGHALR